MQKVPRAFLAKRRKLSKTGMPRLARSSQGGPEEEREMTMLVEASTLTVSLAVGWGAARLAMAALLALAFRSRS